MDINFERDYTLITGVTNFENYTTPEEQANNIEKCSILKRVNMTITDRIVDDSIIHRN